jgi:hypothetical protein
LPTAHWERLQALGGIEQAINDSFCGRGTLCCDPRRSPLLDRSPAETSERSLSKSLDDSLLGRRVTCPFATLELRFGGPNVFDEFGPLDEFLVFSDVEEDRGSTTVLSQYEWPASLLNLANELGGVRTELGEWLDIAGQLG